MARRKVNTASLKSPTTPPRSAGKAKLVYTYSPYATPLYDVYMYICIHVYMYICIYMYIYTHMCACVYIYIYIYIYMYILAICDPPLK